MEHVLNAILHLMLCSIGILVLLYSNHITSHDILRKIESLLFLCLFGIKACDRLKCTFRRYFIMNGIQSPQSYNHKNPVCVYIK